MNESESHELSEAHRLAEYNQPESVTELRERAIRAEEEIKKQLALIAELRAELAAAQADINSLIDNYESANDNCNAAEAERDAALALATESRDRMRAALVPFAKLADVVAVRGCQLDISAFTAARAALDAAPGHRPPVGDAAKEGTR